MSLQLILGPMFAGKSSELLGTIRKYNAIGWPCLILTHSIDIRYSKEPHIVSHDSEKHPAIGVSTLENIFIQDEYKHAKLVIIEEAQFFSSLKSWVLQMVERDKKDVICVGLDGDADRKPFGEILDLIPFCDSVVKKHAFCRRCATPTPAIFTYKKIKEDLSSQIQVGGADLYEPLCRKHYLNYGS